MEYKVIKRVLVLIVLIVAGFTLLTGVSLHLGIIWLEKDNLVYANFREKEKAAIPLFDELNEDVFQSLPPLPEHAEVIEKWSVGIDNPLYQHGRWLFLKIYVPMNEKDFIEYYEPKLLQADWQINNNRSHFEHKFYYKGTSCIQLYFHFSYLRISVWHDFPKQLFSPEFPNLFIMQFRELGETTIATCP